MTPCCSLPPKYACLVRWWKRPSRRPNIYPLSLNALVNACNQSSNRDPVVSYGEPTVLGAVESLRDKKLVFVFAGATSRVAKYGQKLAETLACPPPRPRRCAS